MPPVASLPPQQLLTVGSQSIAAAQNFWRGRTEHLVLRLDGSVLDRSVLRMSSVTALFEKSINEQL